MITDQATFAYLADVFVLPQWRGQWYQQGLDGASWRIPACRTCGA
jgi:hypothetical protein